VKLFQHRRIVAAIAACAIGSLALTGVALAASSGKRHAKRHAAKHAVVRRQTRKTFAPTIISRAAEVSAVELDPLTQQFVQVTYDRGRVTAVGTGTITLQQQQDNAIWRTQTFTVPDTAIVTFDGRQVSLSQIPTGASARIDSSGSVGGSLAVVRVNAYSVGRVVPLPATSSSG
jgi:hypothetical protein